MSTLTRRSLLGGLALCGALLAAAPRSSADMPGLTQTLLSVVGDRRSAAALGEDWIDHRRGGIKAGELVNHLSEALHAQGWSGSTDPGELRQRFAAAVRADFQRDEIVTVAGWRLARSQAELCALAYFASTGLL